MGPLVGAPCVYEEEKSKAVLIGDYGTIYIRLSTSRQHQSAYLLFYFISVHPFAFWILEPLI